MTAALRPVRPGRPGRPGRPRHPGRPRAGRGARVRASWAAALLTLAACGGGSTAEPGESAGGVTGEVVVFAAASLSETFSRLAETFEAGHPGVTVILNLGASSALAQQVLSGAPADVYAAASPVPMARVTEGGAAAGDPVVFARNRLQIAVPAGNPGGVERLADLGDRERTVALCAEQVPCGAAAVQAFVAAGVTPAPDTLEQDVKAALSKVRLGEVDAALVYRTDVLAAEGEVEGIAFPEADRAGNDYPITVLADAPNTAGARAFVDHVLSPDGQRVLADAGFDAA